MASSVTPKRGRPTGRRDASTRHANLRPCDLERVVVYGVMGAGKTEVARRLARVTGVVHTDVDALMWQPGWVQLPEDEQRRRIGRVCASERWVLDTAYSAWADIPLSADGMVVVALDYGRLLTLWRLTRRTVRRVVTKDPTCNGNVETWSNILGGDSILRWHFRTFSKKRASIRALEQDPLGPPVLRFSHPRELSAWLAAA